jgi:hypothetical protein
MADFAIRNAVLLAKTVIASRCLSILFRESPSLHVVGSPFLFGAPRRAASAPRSVHRLSTVNVTVLPYSDRVHAHLLREDSTPTFALRCGGT